MEEAPAQKRNKWAPVVFAAGALLAIVFGVMVIASHFYPNDVLKFASRKNHVWLGRMVLLLNPKAPAELYIEALLTEKNGKEALFLLEWGWKIDSERIDKAFSLANNTWSHKTPLIKKMLSLGYRPEDGTAGAIISFARVRGHEGLAVLLESMGYKEWAVGDLRRFDGFYHENIYDLF